MTESGKPLKNPALKYLEDKLALAKRQKEYNEKQASEYAQEIFVLEILISQFNGC